MTKTELKGSEYQTIYIYISSDFIGLGVLTDYNNNIKEHYIEIQVPIVNLGLTHFTKVVLKWMETKTERLKKKNKHRFSCWMFKRGSVF